jgi:hypothetical protein
MMFISDSSQAELSVPAAVLSRFLAVAGQVALRQLVHLDCAVFGEIKRRHESHDKTDNKGRKPLNSTSATARRKSIKVSSHESFSHLYQIVLK